MQGFFQAKWIQFRSSDTEEVTNKIISLIDENNKDQISPANVLRWLSDDQITAIADRIQNKSQNNANYVNVIKNALIFSQAEHTQKALESSLLDTIGEEEKFTLIKNIGQKVIKKTPNEQIRSEEYNDIRTKIEKLGSLCEKYHVEGTVEDIIPDIPATSKHAANDFFNAGRNVVHNQIAQNKKLQNDLENAISQIRHEIKHSKPYDLQFWQQKLKGCEHLYNQLKNPYFEESFSKKANESLDQIKQDCLREIPWAQAFKIAKEKFVDRQAPENIQMAQKLAIFDFFQNQRNQAIESKEITQRVSDATEKGIYSLEKSPQREENDKKNIEDAYNSIQNKLNEFRQIKDPDALQKAFS